MKKTLLEKYMATNNYKKKMALLKKIRFRENVWNAIILAFAFVGFVALMWELYLFISKL